MSWSRRAALLLLAGGSLAACGFEPMYRQDRAARTTLQFAGFDIKADPKKTFAAEEERLTQMVRNELLDRLQAGGGASLAPRYTLLIFAREGRGAVLVTRTDAVSRFNLSVSATWNLQDSVGAVLATGTVTTLESYNVLRQEFGNLSAEADARQRAARDIADQMRIRLALYFEQRARS